MSGSRYHFQRKHCVKRRKRKPGEGTIRRQDAYEKDFCVCDIALHLLPKFVVLPKSKKTKMARLATYAPALQNEMKLYSPVIESGKMLEINHHVSNGLNMWPLDEVVTQSALVNPDFVGWLTNQSSGQRRWAVVADMLFCLFANSMSEQPTSVLVLPGHEIKSMLFKSAKRDSIQENQRGQPLTRTISGMLKHQFMIRNPSTGKEHVFALEDKAERDQWVAMLRVAANLDADIFNSDSDDSNDNFEGFCNGNQNNNDVESKNSLNALTTSQLDNSISSPNTSAQNGNVARSASRRSSLSRSLSIHVVPQSDSPGDSRVLRYIPSSRCSAEPRLSKHLSTLNISENLCDGPMFIRRHSMQDLTEQQGPVSETEEVLQTQMMSRSLKTSKSSKRLSTWFNKDAPVMSFSSKYPSPAPRSNHQRKKFTNKLARKMSSIRVKLKNGRVQEGVDMPRLGSIQEFTMSGFLKVKCHKKWSTMWCIIAQGNLYCYKSQSVHERPEHMLPLHQCSVQAVRRSPYNNNWCVFKISHLNAYCTFFCTEDTLDYAQWMMVLKTESRVCDNIASPPSDTPYQTLSDEDSGSSTMSLPSDRSETSFSDELMRSRLSVQHSSANMSQSSRNVSFVIPNAQNLKFRESKRNLSESDTSISDGELKTSHLVTPQHKERRQPSNPLFATLFEHKKQIAAIAEMKLRRNGSDESVYSEQSHGSVGSHDHQNNLLTPSGYSRTLTKSCSRNGGASNAKSKLLRLKTKRNAEARARSRTEPISPVTSSPYSSSHTLNGSLLSQSSWTDHFVRSAFENSYSSFDSFHDHPTDDSESDRSSVDKNNVNELLKTMPGFRQSLTCKYTAPPTYDQNLKQVWKSGQYSPVGMLSATMPDRPAIFRRHLPGPNNEGVLLVSDGVGAKGHSGHPDGAISLRVHGGSFKNVRREKTLAQRKRSLSDGNLCESLRQFQESIKRIHVQDNIAARDIESPSLAGYLERKDSTGSWKSCWYVLKDSSLYRYSAPVDDTTEDILLLHGYEVLRCPEVNGNEFAFELLHPDYPSELLAASASEELTEWIAKLKQATHHMSLDGLDLEQGSSKQQLTVNDKKVDETKVKHCSKQQLLQEVLQEKMRLEQSQRRKRKERSRLGDVFHKDHEDPSPLGSASSTPELSPDVVSLTSYSSCASVRVSGQSQSQFVMEQSLREISHLRQRKASTQLKVETLQRQLTMSAATKQKPRRFKLGLGNKSHNAGKEPVQTDNKHIHRQINDLQGELDKISNTLEVKKKLALGDLGTTDSKTLTKKKGHGATEELQLARGSYNSGPSISVVSMDSKRNSDATVNPQNGNGGHRVKSEVSRTSSAEPAAIRHSWDTVKDQSNDRTSCEPVSRERAYTTPEELNARSRQGSTSSQCEIDPAVMAQISAFEELLQERLHIQ